MDYTKFLAVAGVAAMFAACGGDSSSGTKAPELVEGSDIVVETFGDFSSSSEVIQEVPVMVSKDKSISGVSQKGPFVTGSAVKLYELDGKTYAQTGKNFTGKIDSDDGKFSVSSGSLASPYALLEAKGYFRNELTGRKSRVSVTLNALTDLSAREKVNINLLTHLEYGRVLYLVGTGINVPAAKKQAEAEIFNAFGIQGEFANSEDLNIFGKGEGNAALLAFSVLMLHDLSEADLNEFLFKFAMDIEKDGSWDDSFTKAKIADWAQSKDLAGSLKTIRSNIENWNLGSVPEFEKYVRNFWYTNYGLGSCAANNEGKVMVAKNQLSMAYNMHFICKSGAWVEASDFEKDSYQWAAGEDGELREGSVTGVMYKYDEALGMWVAATYNDRKLELMGCTTNRTGEIGKSLIGSGYYICKNSDWWIAQKIEYDPYGGEKCTSAEVGKIIVGVVTGTNKYYCSADGWVSLDGWSWDVPKEARLNSEITYGTMTDSRDSKKYKIVTIGDQIWMAENLNYYDADDLSVKTKSWCYGKSDNKDSTTCDVAGRLYSWAAAIDSVKLVTDADNPQDCGYGKTCTLPAKVQGICPTGWHLPTHAEWKALFTTVGDSDFNSDLALKSQTGWYGYRKGTDAFGFSALPGGIRYFGGYIDSDSIPTAGEIAAFWSASEGDSFKAYAMGLHDADEYASLMWNDKNNGFSVRCLKD